MNRLDPQALRDRLYADKSWSKKELGQHFLVDGMALFEIVEAADIKPTDTILEIGPGLGVLTEELVKKAGKVIAFELDPHMAQIIREDFPSVELIEGDVLQTASAVVQNLASYKVVANIPYQITTALFKLFMEGGVSHRPEQMVLLIQKEVAERLSAPAGHADRRYLSVLCQYYSQISYGATVPRTSFWPSPSVDSAVISLHSRPELPLSGKEESDFLRYVKAAFLQPRKQLKNVLAGMRGISTKEMEERLVAVGLPVTARAQELTQDQWLTLFKGGI